MNGQQAKHALDIELLYYLDMIFVDTLYNSCIFAIKRLSKKIQKLSGILALEYHD